MKKRNRHMPDHSYLFSGMTDAEFAAEGVRMAQSERGEADRTDEIPDEDSVLPDDEPKKSS